MHPRYVLLTRFWENGNSVSGVSCLLFDNKRVLDQMETFADDWSPEA